MPIHDYLIDNQTGINFRADLNNVLFAIVSNNSNPTEPTTTFAYMWWADTTAGLLKQRNSSNTGWVDILDLTTGASVSTSINDLTNAIADALNNIALGFGALGNITIGIKNIAVGTGALANNTTGDSNTALGDGALENNITGDNNTALGDGALQNNTTASSNIAIGKNALNANTIGVDDTAVGSSALASNTVGSNNIAMGKNALANNTTGVHNTALGAYALQYNTTGMANTVIGAHAGHNITTLIDYCIAIGDNVSAIDSNYCTMGKGDASDRVYNQFTANATWTRASDERIKKDIETNEDCGLGFINDLRTVTYKFKSPSELDADMSEYDKDNDKPSHDKKMYGFIAQEVKEVLDNHNIKNFSGWHVDEKGKDKLQGISYEMFVMPLVKAVQELSTKNKELMERVEDLENLTR